MLVLGFWVSLGWIFETINRAEQERQQMLYDKLHDKSVYTNPSTWLGGHIELQPPWPDEEPPDDEPVGDPHGGA